MWNTVMAPDFNPNGQDQRPLQGTHLAVCWVSKKGGGIPGFCLKWFIRNRLL